MIKITSPKNVALVGRINVGKSSLFNRLVGKKIALVSDMPGTTRDRRVAVVEWNNININLIDTGGVEQTAVAADEWQNLITEQTELALAGTDLAVLVVSARDGVMPQDRAWAKRLRGKVPTLLVVNKVDNAKHDAMVTEFFELGLDEPIPVSATTGRQTGDLLDKIVNKLNTLPKRRRSAKATTLLDPDAMRLAILGQPNAGKSSIINALLGEKRVITSGTAHTTREAHDIPFSYQNHSLIIIDTPGIRRAKVKRESLEKESIAASLETAKRVEAIILVIDAERGPTVQDQHLAADVAKQGNALVVVINKWDLIPDKTTHTMKEYEKKFRDQLPGLDWAPMIFVSAVTKQRVREILDTAIVSVQNRRRQLDDDTLLNFVKSATKQHRPARGGGIKHPAIVAFTQNAITPPSFEITVKGELHPSYLRFLENRMREHFELLGTPVHITMHELRHKTGK